MGSKKTLKIRTSLMDAPLSVSLNLYFGYFVAHLAKKVNEQYFCSCKISESNKAEHAVQSYAAGEGLLMAVA